MNDGKDKSNAISIKHILKNYSYSFRFVWKYSKCYLFFSVFISLIGVVVSPVEMLLTNRLFSMLEEHAAFGEALIVILVQVSITFGYLLFRIIYESVLSPIFSQTIHLKVQSEFFEKVRCMELSKYDDPDFYNEFVLTMQNADSYATSALNGLNRVFSSVLSIGAIAGIFANIDFVAMLIMVASAVFETVTDMKRNKVDFQKQIDGMPINRKQEYIDRVHKRAEFAKELRLTDFGDVLTKEYNKNTEEYISFAKKYGKKTAILRFCFLANSRGMYLVIVAWAAYRMIVEGSVTLGGFSVVVSSCLMFKGTLTAFFNRFSGLAKSSMYIDKVRAFMEYEPNERKGKIPAPRFESIELKNVSFGYNADIPVLHEISLKLTKGEKIAIVGYNGAGKSTLIKLLMHLYEPTRGKIMYNGNDIGVYELDSYRSHIGAVFQDFKIFAATIGENVMGDECSENDRKTVEYALHMAGFDEKLQSLSDGTDTILTREYDENGTNLSGGEAQKIAIARVFAHPFDLVIMDEPSAALDPIAEYTMNQHISEYAADKTVIFISHRLSSTKKADRIYMLENGRIIESGNHIELMALNGKYAEMFNIQAENYR